MCIEAVIIPLDSPLGLLGCEVVNCPDLLLFPFIPGSAV